MSPHSHLTDAGEELSLAQLSGIARELAETRLALAGARQDGLPEGGPIEEFVAVVARLALRRAQKVEQYDSTVDQLRELSALPWSSTAASPPQPRGPVEFHCCAASALAARG